MLDRWREQRGPDARREAASPGARRAPQPALTAAATRRDREPRPRLLPRVPRRGRARERDPRAGRRRRSPSDRGRALAPFLDEPAPHRRPQPAARDRRRARRAGARPRGVEHVRLLRPLLAGAVPAAARRAAVGRAPLRRASGWEHIADALAGGNGRHPRAAAPRAASTSRPAWLAGRGVGTDGRRRAGRAAGAVRVVRAACGPRSGWRSSRSGPTRARRSCARSRRTGSSACCPTATSRATASRSSSSASGPRCPAGPATLALRTGAPLIPAGVYFRPHGRHFAHDRPAAPGASARVACATMSRRITQELARRFEELIRMAPEQWHLMQPNWPSDRAAGRRRR